VGVIKFGKIPAGATGGIKRVGPDHGAKRNSRQWGFESTEAATRPRIELIDATVPSYNRFPKSHGRLSGESAAHFVTKFALKACDWAKCASSANNVTINSSWSLYEVSVRANHYFPPADLLFLLANILFLPAIDCPARGNFERATKRFCNRFPLYL